MFWAKINLVVALPAEAKPLLQLFALQRRQPDQGLPVYINEHIALIVTGPGIAAATEGVRQLRGQNENQLANWLNIGIAGHATHPVGKMIIASKVIHSETQKAWLLVTPEGLICKRSQVHTVKQPVSDYIGDITYDMEAAGFVSAALECSHRDKLQVLKIISDNRNNSTKAINAKLVSKLIHGQTEMINHIISRNHLNV